MPNRRKRLEKGIKSLDEQIKIHGVKKEDAIKEENFGLANYYEKEIGKFERVKEKKKEMRENT